MNSSRLSLTKSSARCSQASNLLIGSARQPEWLPAPQACKAEPAANRTPARSLSAAGAAAPRQAVALGRKGGQHPSLGGHHFTLAGQRETARDNIAGKSLAVSPSLFASKMHLQARAPACQTRSARET